MICNNCKEDKEIEEFSWKEKSKNKRNTTCKKCVSIKVKKHYINNKQKYKDKARVNNKAYIKRNQEFLINYLKINNCVDCGENDIRVLDFDHQGNKLKNVSRMIFDSHSIDTIKKEIEKCEVRCANCHRKRHSMFNNTYRYLPT